MHKTSNHYVLFVSVVVGILIYPFFQKYFFITHRVFQYTNVSTKNVYVIDSLVDVDSEENKQY